MALSYEQAEELLHRYNEGDFHLKHSYTVSDTMRWFATDMGHANEAETWAVVGLLHDLDYEQFPDEHCTKTREILEAEGVDETIIRACVSHAWPKWSDCEPLSDMERALFAVDELTGLIGAVAIMRPSKSVDDLPVKSVKKMFKDKRFAAGCDRDVISLGAERLGWDLDTLIEKTILAMRESSHVE